MNTQTNEHRLQELEEENELLLLQLHQVQEELERYYLRNQELEKGGVGAIGNTTAAHGWVDEQVPETLAETARLNTLLATQTYLQRIESTRALNARLGNMLIQSASQGGSLLSVPGKLLKIWRESEKDAIPAALGGKSGDKVIAAYRKGGLEAVNGLLTDINAPMVKANVYTLLARQLRNEDWEMTAQLARLAYEEDPRPYRLKWLAFRLYEAGEIAEADAMLALLPEDTTFSDSELRQQDQIRYEANSIRLREAKQTTNFDHRRQAIEGQLKQLQQEHTTQTNLAIERQQQIETLQHEQVQLEQEKEDLVKRCEESNELINTRDREIEELRQTQVQLGLERAELAKHHEKARELITVRDSEVEKLQQEKIASTKQLEEADKLAAARLKQIGELQKQIQNYQASETELASRQQMMQEEMVRAEAQIDLIKDLLLQEAGI